MPTLPYEVDEIVIPKDRRGSWGPGPERAGSCLTSPGSYLQDWDLNPGPSDSRAYIFRPVYPFWPSFYFSSSSSPATFIEHFLRASWTQSLASSAPPFHCEGQMKFCGWHSDCYSLAFPAKVSLWVALPNHSQLSFGYLVQELLWLCCY